MTRAFFIEESDRLAKLVRTEYGLTQDSMAANLGLSKKTLVEIEKGRSSLGWMGAVALCSIFSESRVLANQLDGNIRDMVRTLAFEELKPQYPQTLGGKVWWRTLENYRGFLIQQNIISQHYRALNQDNRRICCSFELLRVKQRLDGLEVQR